MKLRLRPRDRMRTTKTRPPPSNRQKSPHALHRATIKSGHLRSGQSFPGPANLFSLFFSRRQEQAKPQSFNLQVGLEGKKDGAHLPRPARRGDQYLGQDGPRRLLTRRDETEGLASCRPTLGESLWFRTAQPLLDGAGLATGPHALRHVVKSPTTDRDFQK